jgi:hypothetical protein
MSDPLSGQAVIDAFVAAAASKSGDVGTSEALHRLAGSSASPIDGTTAARAVLTRAANALRDATGRPPVATIANSDAAFQEDEAVRHAEGQAEGHGSPWDEGLKHAAASLSEALGVAADRLGPIPGGRPSSGGVVEEVRPTGGDLRDIAHAAGAAIGRLDRAGRIDAVKELTRLLGNA